MVEKLINEVLRVIGGKSENLQTHGNYDMTNAGG